MGTGAFGKRAQICGKFGGVFAVKTAHAACAVRFPYDFNFAVRCVQKMQVGRRVVGERGQTPPGKAQEHLPFRLRDRYVAALAHPSVLIAVCTAEDACACRAVFGPPDREDEARLRHRIRLSPKNETGSPDFPPEAESNRRMPQVRRRLLP